MNFAQAVQRPTTLNRRPRGNLNLLASISRCPDCVIEGYTRFRRLWYRMNLGAPITARRSAVIANCNMALLPGESHRNGYP